MPTCAGLRAVSHYRVRPPADGLQGGHQYREVSAQIEEAVGSKLSAQGSGAAGALTGLDSFFFPCFPLVFLASYHSFFNGDKG